MSGAIPDSLSIENVIAGIQRSQAETRKFVAEQQKLIAEQQKLNAEADKLRRDRAIIPWQIMATLLGAGAALFGAGAAFIKVIGG